MWTWEHYSVKALYDVDAAPAAWPDFCRWARSTAISAARTTIAQHAFGAVRPSVEHPDAVMYCLGAL